MRVRGSLSTSTVDANSMRTEPRAVGTWGGVGQAEGWGEGVARGGDEEGGVGVISTHSHYDYHMFSVFFCFLCV